MPDLARLESSPVLRLLVGAAAAGVLLLVLKQLSPVLVPFLQAAFVAIIAARPVSYLKRHRVPQAAAVAIVILGLVITFWMLGIFVTGSVGEMGRELPLYEEKIRSVLAALGAALRDQGLEVPEGGIEQMLDPGAVLRFFARSLQQLGGGIAKAIFVLIIVLFALLEAPKISARLRATGEHRLEGFRRLAGILNRYLLIKTWMSLGTGTTIGLVLAGLGVDFAALWGLLAFLLNYIPNIGSLVAAVPAIVLAFLKLGAGGGLATLVAYVAVNVFFSNILEPRLMGISLGLSPLVILFSILLWGWVFGITGVFLAVPLTMTVKLLLEAHPDTEQIAVLLGSHVEVKAEVLGGPSPSN
jgi:predicted PurR-regulated permease PerM